MANQEWKCSKCGGVNPGNKERCMGCNSPKDTQAIEAKNREKFTKFLSNEGNETGIEIYCQEAPWMKLINTVTCEVINAGNRNRYPLQPNKSVFIKLQSGIDYEIKVGVAQAIVNNLTYVAKFHATLSNGEIQCYQYIPPATSLNTAKLIRENIVKANVDPGADNQSIPNSTNGISRTNENQSSLEVHRPATAIILVVVGVVALLIFCCIGQIVINGLLNH